MDIFSEICTIDGSDGVLFDAENIEVQHIREGEDYQGVRALVSCHLGKALKVLQIDIGIGDVVIPRPQEMQYPVILDMESPDIDKQRQWTAFVNRTTKTAVPFEQIMNRMKCFIFPVYDSLLNEKEFLMQWTAKRKAWERQA